MAKSLRSSRNKANKSKLRSNVFGPAETERKERLSAKLLELASERQPTNKEGLKMRNDEGEGWRLLDQTPQARISLILCTFSDNARTS